MFLEQYTHNPFLIRMICDKLAGSRGLSQEEQWVLDILHHFTSRKCKVSEKTKKIYISYLLMNALSFSKYVIGEHHFSINKLFKWCAEPIQDEEHRRGFSIPVKLWTDDLMGWVVAPEISNHTRAGRLNALKFLNSAAEYWLNTQGSFGTCDVGQYSASLKNFKRNLTGMAASTERDLETDRIAKRSLTQFLSPKEMKEVCDLSKDIIRLERVKELSKKINALNQLSDEDLLLKNRQLSQCCDLLVAMLAVFNGRRPQVYQAMDLADLVQAEVVREKSIVIFKVGQLKRGVLNFLTYDIKLY